MEIGVSRREVAGVLAAYNHENFAYDAIASLATQVEEIVVVDDASTDQTQSEIRRAARDFENVTYHFNQINEGPSKSVNKAVSMAKSDIILLTAGDDLSLPNRRRIQEAQLLDSPDSFVFGMPEIVDATGQALSGSCAPEFLDDVTQADIYFRLLVQGNFLCATSAGFTKELFMSLGGFERHLLQLQDWFLWLRAARSGKIRFSRHPVSKYRKHHGNLSGENHGKAAERDARARIEKAYIIARELEDLKGTPMHELLNLPKVPKFYSDASEILLALQSLLRKDTEVDLLDLNVTLTHCPALLAAKEYQGIEFDSWIRSHIRAKNSS